MASRAEVVLAKGRARAAPSLLLLVLFGLSPLGGTLREACLKHVARILPGRVRSHWLFVRLATALKLVDQQDFTGDPFTRIRGGIAAFKKLYRVGEEIAVTHNNTMFYVCRLRESPDQDLVAKLVPRDQHPLLRIGMPRSKSGFGIKNMTRSQDVLETEGFICYMRELLQLRHTNVVRYARFFADESTYYFVMERCLGAPLQDFVMKQPSCTEAGVRPLQCQLLTALAYVHGRGLIHRDVKMENIFVSPNGDLKLLDFGLGCLFRTAVGEVGTVGYTAPEVFSNHLYGPGVDIFSAGVVLHLLFSGQAPFRPCEKVEDRIQQISAGPKYDALAFGVVSQAGMNLLARMIHPWASSRISSADALKHRWCAMEAPLGGGPKLWSTADSDVEFLSVMGVWSGSFSQSGSTVGAHNLLGGIAEGPGCWYDRPSGTLGGRKQSSINMQPLSTLPQLPEDETNFEEAGCWYGRQTSEEGEEVLEEEGCWYIRQTSTVEPDAVHHEFQKLDSKESLAEEVRGA